MASCIKVIENQKQRAISSKIPCDLRNYQLVPQLAVFDIDLGGPMSILNKINSYTVSHFLPKICSKFGGHREAKSHSAIGFVEKFINIIEVANYGNIK